jgi:hypothetical protein
MNEPELRQLLERHEAFLECRPVERPLISLWNSGYFPAEQFPRGTSSWRDAERLQPDDVSFLPFAPDYEDLHRVHQAQKDDFFLVGSPYWGIPWLEAILGCPVTVSATNGRAEPCLDSLKDVDRLTADIENNPWLDALLRFTQDLVKFAAGRFPVCPPLLRGAGDAASSLLGGQVFVMGMLDDPARMKTLLEHCARVRLSVLQRLHQLIPPWHGTHAAGGYPSKVWCRRTVAYYQEDCAALLNPRLFREFALPPAQQMCQAAEVNFIHLHSACLYPVDILLEDACFDILEINIDHEGAGPQVPKLIPTFQKIQRAGQPLVLWGNCRDDEWALIRRELSPVGLSLQPFAAFAQT